MAITSWGNGKVAIESGQQLLHYRIVEKIGEGGMGVVWKARDTTLERDVAIKLLPDRIGRDPDGLGRFRREAKTLATLNHPGIAAVFGMHEADTPTGPVQFIAMELVEGEDLAERLKRGAIRVEQALEIAAQLAEALDVAHQRGIVHRDLKPANIKIDIAGNVRVLDFGLAKAIAGPAPDGGSPDVSVQPTVSLGGTAVGTILGTAAYMSPQQARGESVDKRTDIWAFGVVLWEMLTGQRLFAGPTMSDTLAAVLQKPVDLAALPPGAPPALRRLLERCLERDLAKRLRDIGDGRVEIHAAQEEQARGAKPTKASRPYAWLAAVLVVALVAFAVGRLLPGKEAEESPRSRIPLHLSVSLPDGLRIAGWASPTLALSRDGRSLSYVATDERDENHLYVHQLDRNETVQVPDSLSAEGPFFAPDGKWVGFAVGVSSRAVVAPELKKYSLATGLTQSVAPIEDWFGGSWREDGTIWFVGLVPEGLQSVPASGGTPIALLEEPTLENDAPTTYAWPQLIPGTDILIVTLWDGLDPEAGVIDVAKGTISSLGVGASFAQWLPTGHLLFVFRDGGLQVAPFDLERRVLSGPQVALMDDVSRGANDGPVLAVTADGMLAYSRGYLRGSSREPLQIMRLRSGRAPEPTSFPAVELGGHMRLSPDGTRLAVKDADGRARIFDLERGTDWNLAGCEIVWRMAWSPDGKSIYCSDYGQTIVHLRQGSVDGGGSVGESLLSSKYELQVGDASPDGKRLVYLDASTAEVIELALDGSGDRSTLFTDKEARNWMRYSPDGRWLAYISGRSGKTAAWLRPASSSGAAVVVSVGGADYLAWSPDGRRLYYESDDKVFEVSIGAGNPPAIGDPVFVLDLPDVVSWDVLNEDGELVALQRVPGGGVQTEVLLVLNWFDEVRRLTSR